jgi:tRNA(Ile)-lysidine synthase
MTPDHHALSADEFAALMARFEPFEPAPQIAIAVSGGADSMALALLAHAWAQSRGGAATALTVDHRLRPESAAEAERVGAALARHGIAHAILVREGAPPAANIEAAARGARYRLLEGWCGTQGVLHLLTAHHRDDQAETLLLRLARGSGLDGLAGMAPVAERGTCRILRPFLMLPRTRLSATLAARGEDWIEDPMNRDPVFARARLRAAADLLSAEGLGAERLAATAAHLGRARAALEAGLAALLAHAFWIHRAGFGWLDPAPLKEAPEEVALRGLAAVLTALGGATYPPRLESLLRLWREIATGLLAARTLGGAIIEPRRGKLLVRREAAAAAPPVPAPPGARVSWDGRFVLDMPAQAPAGLSLGALGQERGPWSEALLAIPAPARPSLPALRDGKGVAAVPHLAYGRAGIPAFVLRFRPVRSLTAPPFVWGAGQATL